MRLRLLSFVTAAVAVASLSCHPGQQLTPVTPVDSTLSVQFPDVKAVAARSLTPKGALDQLVRKSSITYSPSWGVSRDSIVIQFLYNDTGQIAGYQRFSFGQIVTSETEQQQLDRQANYGVVYEYRDNRPYRIYSKGANRMVTPTQDVFYMSEFIYETTSTHPRYKQDYTVSALGKATPTYRYELVYDQAGNLSESKDVNGYLIHQRFIYQDGNVRRTETIDPKTTIPQPNSHMEYEYDRQVNPTKNLFWQGNYDDTELTVNVNNVIQSRLVDSNPSYKTYIQNYVNRYDSQGRIIQRTAIINNSLTDIGRTDWLYQYRQ